MAVKNLSAQDVRDVFNRQAQEAALRQAVQQSNQQSSLNQNQSLNKAGTATTSMATSPSGWWAKIDNDLYASTASKNTVTWKTSPDITGARHAHVGTGRDRIYLGGIGTANFEMDPKAAIELANALLDAVADVRDNQEEACPS